MYIAGQSNIAVGPKSGGMSPSFVKITLAFENSNNKLRAMTRRDFVKTSALAWTGFVTGCRRNIPPQIMFKGWPYEPQIVRHNIEFFAQQSNISVGYEAVSGNYHNKMVALFVRKMPADCCYVRDDDLAEWLEAGWLRSYEDLPGIEQHSDDFFAYNLEAMTYDGKRYGLPYYTDFTVWIYNERMLESAGFQAAARTLEELADTIKFRSPWTKAKRGRPPMKT